LEQVKTAWAGRSTAIVAHGYHPALSNLTPRRPLPTIDYEDRAAPGLNNRTDTRRSEMAHIPVVDQTLCISCGLCTEVAANTFELDENNLSRVIDPTGDPEEVIQEAIDSCPVEAISWEED
jgi:ferredoxin